MNFHTIKVLLMGSLIQPQDLFCKYTEFRMKASCPKGFGWLSLDNSQPAPEEERGEIGRIVSALEDYKKKKRCRCLLNATNCCIHS